MEVPGGAAGQEDGAGMGSACDMSGEHQKPGFSFLGYVTGWLHLC